MYETTVQEQLPIPETHISGFWRRTFAFLFDLFVLAIVGVILGLFFGKQFAEMGTCARSVGFLLSIAYFGVLNSSISGGQTLGKTMAGIKIITASGNFLPIGTSLLRAAILFVPSYTDVFTYASPTTVNTIIVAIIAVIANVLALGTFYLFIFNRKTRQAPHDLICRSYVIRSGMEGEFRPATIAKSHYVVLGLLLCLLLVSAIPIRSYLSAKLPFANMTKVQQELFKLDNVLTAGVSTGYITGPSGRKEHVNAQLVMKKYQPTNAQETKELSKKIARTILEKYPEAAKKDFIGTKIDYGYNIGIWKSTTFYSYTKTPSEWAEELKQ